jgi:hypothetical protein
MTDSPLLTWSPVGSNERIGIFDEFEHYNGEGYQVTPVKGDVGQVHQDKAIVHTEHFAGEDIRKDTFDACIDDKVEVVASSKHEVEQYKGEDNIATSLGHDVIQFSQMKGVARAENLTGDDPREDTAGPCIGEENNDIRRLPPFNFRRFFEELERHTIEDPAKWKIIKDTFYSKACASSAGKRSILLSLKCFVDTLYPGKQCVEKAYRAVNFPTPVVRKRKRTAWRAQCEISEPTRMAGCVYRCPKCRCTMREMVSGQKVYVCTMCHQRNSAAV